MTRYANLFNSHIRIVGGKGGVGKSTISLMMASYAAKMGKRVLFLEANPATNVLQKWGLEPLTGQVREVFDNLFMANLIPEECVKEYALLILKYKILYKRVFENRFVKAFLQAVPGLSHFVMMGKLWFHHQEKNEDGSNKYDLIIVDAPASGHLKSWLLTPLTFKNMLQKGPFHKSAIDFVEMLQNPEKTRLDIVTIGEEMPVNETLMILNDIIEKNICNKGYMFLNRLPHPLSDDLIKILQTTTPETASLEIAVILAELKKHQHRVELCYRSLAPLKDYQDKTAILIGESEHPIQVFEDIKRLSKYLGKVDVHG